MKRLIKFKNNATIYNLDVESDANTITLTGDLPEVVNQGFDILDDDGNSMEGRGLYTTILSQTDNSVTLTHQYYFTPTEDEQLRADLDYFLMMQEDE